MRANTLSALMPDTWTGHWTLDNPYRGCPSSCPVDMSGAVQDKCPVAVKGLLRLIQSGGI